MLKVIMKSVYGSHLYGTSTPTSEIDRVMQIPNELPEPDYDFWNNWLLDKYMLQAYEQSSEYLKLRGLTP